MNDQEIERLREAVDLGWSVMYIPLGKRIERIGVAPLLHGEVPEPTKVAFLSYPPTDYVALYNCSLKDFGIIQPIP